MPFALIVAQFSKKDGNGEEEVEEEEADGAVLDDPEEEEEVEAEVDEALEEGTPGLPG